MLLGSRITADGDCSHEIKRPLLLRRKVMTNLDSILKSRDITLLTKIHVVKAMIFPAVMYRCELDHKEGLAPKSWSFQIMVPKTFESPLDSRRSNLSILKEINPEYLLDGLMLKLKLKLQNFGCLMWEANSLEKTLVLRLKAKEGVTEDEMVRSQYRLNGLEFDQTLKQSGGQRNLAHCSGCQESDMT